MLTTQYHPDALANDFALFCDDVRRIEGWRDLFSQGPPVSAMTIVPNEASLESIVEASRSILFANHGRNVESIIWVFLADGPWQDNTRLTNYWKIWRYLEQEGIDWPEDRKGPEIAFRSANHIRYATTGVVNSDNFGVAMTIMFQLVSTSFMLISSDSLASKSSIQRLFDSAFSRLDDGIAETHVDWGRLIKLRAIQGDVIIKRAGLFDESAWSLDLFARPDVLEKLRRRNESG